MTARMHASTEQVLELGEIQGMVLRPRPMPYVGSYLLYEITDPAHGRELLRRLRPHVTTAAGWDQPTRTAWLNVVLTHEGLRRLGVPEPVLAGFPRELREPMRTRAAFLGDVGASDPALWNLDPHGRFHAGVLLMAPDGEAFDAAFALGEAALQGLPGVTRIDRLDVASPASLREHFGFRDGISQPFVEGQGGTPLPGQRDVARAGEFLLGYVDELGEVAAGPGPEPFWRNGTYLSIRKLHQDVAAFRRFLRDNAEDVAGQELLAAKLVGRWRSGAPLALTPQRDDEALAVDPQRNNAFAYYDTDRRGVRTPVGAHIRRVNPRDALKDGIVDARLHRLLRRGAVYGPELPDGALDDDGVDRGLVLTFVNAHPARQFEFVQSQWVNDGDFVSAGRDTDPVAGTDPRGTGTYTFPARPIRRRLHGVSSFAVTRGGENVFLPGMSGLRLLADGRW